MALFNRFDANYLPKKGLSRVDPPASYICTLTEAKTHLRILHSDDDTYITSLIKVAQMTAEYYCNTDFTGSTWIFKCDLWEQTKQLPYSEIRTISSIEYYDNDGTLQTLNSSKYYLDTSIYPNRIALKDNESYPDLRDGIGNISVNFTTQNISNSEVAKQAVLIMLTDMYENRQSVIVGRIASTIPRTAQYLLDTLKVQVL